MSSDQDTLTSHWVTADDVKAFACSKAFQSETCHWKSHKTFTQFYLKDMALAESELFHLGPVVAAQLIHQ